MSWREWRHFLEDITEEENMWRGRDVTYPGERHKIVGWFPCPIAPFVSLLTEAMLAVPGPRFLDVGAGPGTKVALASKLFGLDAAGIELAPEMVVPGRGVELGDARTYRGYGLADVVYMNRPILPPQSLERLVMQYMRPGAVLILVNAVTRPSDEGWHIVSEELAPGPVSGVWAKP